MADPQFPAVPQAFTFRAGQQTQNLVGVITSFNGSAGRRSATHVFPKRDGGIEEDMGAEQLELSTRLQFTGPDCAARYKRFAAAVAKNPIGLLVHPIAGRWQAFCKGPRHQVDLGRAVTQIEVTVDWKQTELPSATPTDTPDVATGAQNVTGQLQQWEQTIAGYMAYVALAQGLPPVNQIAITAVLSTVDAITAPIDAMQAVVDANLGARQTVINAINAIVTKAATLANDVAGYVNTCTDLFEGDQAAASSLAIASQLGTLQADTEDLEQQLLAAAPSAAAAADAFADTEVLLELCLTLSDAVQASQPPIVKYVVTVQSNLIVLAQRIIKQLELGSTAEALALSILALNAGKIPNPAAIAAGTELQVPTQ
jgi:prophage DNA circulation protein